VIPGLNDDQLIIGCAVNEAVFVVDPPGPDWDYAAGRAWQFDTAQAHMFDRSERQDSKPGGRQSNH
jgi:hypothetical protein